MRAKKGQPFKGPVACARVGDLQTRPIRGSKTLQCSKCSHKITVAPSSLQVLANGFGPLMCLECFAEWRSKRANPNDRWLSPTLAQVKEIKSFVDELESN